MSGLRMKSTEEMLQNGVAAKFKLEQDCAELKQNRDAIAKALGRLMQAGLMLKVYDYSEPAREHFQKIMAEIGQQMAEGGK